MGDEPVAQLRAMVATGEFGRATELLYRAHADDVLRFVRFLKPDGSADDVCQEVWLAVRRGLPRFRFEAMPRTWLFGIVKRRLADERRQRERHPRVRLPSTTTGLQEVLLASLAAPRPPSTPSSRLRRERRAALLAQELARLASGERELLELRFVANLTPSHIVKVLGLSDTPNTVSKRIVRMVRTLRERLLAHDEFRSP